VPVAPSSPAAGARVATSSPPEVLPAQARLRRRPEFTAVVRSGRRAGRPTLVLHYLPERPVARSGGPLDPGAGPRAGFVVGKTVGNSVCRHRVTRQLRHLVGARLDRLPWAGFHWRVVIALGITWVLDGLEVTLVGSLAGAIHQSPSLALTETQIGLTASAYAVGAAMSAPVAGRLLPRFGQKVLVVAYDTSGSMPDTRAGVGDGPRTSSA